MALEIQTGINPSSFFVIFFINNLFNFPILLTFFSAPPTSSSAPPSQEKTIPAQISVETSADALSSPLKDQASVQVTNTNSKDLISFSPEHDNLIMNVSEPSYT